MATITSPYDHRDLALLAVQSLTHGLVMLGADGTIVWSNPVAAHILGMTHDQLVGRHPTDPGWQAVRADGTPWPGDSHPGMHTLATGEAVVDATIGVRRPDGTLRSLSVTSRPTTLPDGTRGATASFVDVTLLRGEADSNRIEARAHRVLFEHGGVPSAVLRMSDRVIVDVNDAACDWLGYSKDELLGMPVPVIADPSNAERAARDLRELSEHGFIERDMRFTHRDGSPLWGRFNATVLTGPERSSGEVICHAIDITTNKLLAVDLERSRGVYRAALDAIQDPLFVCRCVREPAPDGEQGRIIDFQLGRMNEAAARALGSDRPSLAGTRLLEAMPHLRTNGRFEQFRSVIQTGQPLSYEFSSTLGSAEVRTYEAHVVKAGDGLVVLLHDVTERRGTQQTIEQAARLESLGVLAGGMAHDFNNLLMAILGNTSLVLDQLSPGSPHAPLLADVINAAERATQLTRQLLEYAQRSPRRSARIDLAELIGAALPQLRSMVPPDAALIVDTPPGSMVMADLSQLTQVVVNLVSNAVEALETGPGSVTLRTFHLEERADPVAGGVTTQYVCIQVVDTGRGMSAQTARQMFDPFFSTKFTGRGLGLAAVHGIVTATGGTIHVESTPGAGTTVTVRLPAAHPA